MRTRIPYLILTMLLMYPFSSVSSFKWTIVVRIRADGSVDPSSAPIHRYGNVYTLTGNIFVDTSSDIGILVERDGIVLDGASHKVYGVRVAPTDGILVYSNDVVIENLIAELDISVSGWRGLNSPEPRVIVRNAVVKNVTLINGSIKFLYVQDSRIENITAIGEPAGIFLGGYWPDYPCKNNMIYNNNITGCLFGIYLKDDCEDNVVCYNNIVNLNGAKAYGIVSGGLNNVFYSNNMIGKFWTAAMDEGSGNTWYRDYPQGGNYWSDFRYLSKDYFYGPHQNMSGSDGIVDGPNMEWVYDCYPLVGPIDRLEALTSDGKLCYVDIVSNSTISNFHANAQEASVQFTVTGKNETSGFCRVCIPKALVFSDYSVRIDNGSAEIFSQNLALYDNSTHRWLYFAYKNPTHEIRIQGIQPPDTTPPAISILSPQSKAYAVKDVQLAVVSSEPTSWIGYSLDGNANVTISGNKTITSLSEGEHSVIVYANDTAGNIGRSNIICFSVDTISPVIEILSPINQTYTTGSVALSFAVNEAIQWAGYSLDEKANITIVGNTTLNGLSTGIHSITVYAKDAAGNLGVSKPVYFSNQAETITAFIVAAVVIMSIAIASACFLRVKKRTSRC